MPLILYVDDDAVLQVDGHAMLVGDDAAARLNDVPPQALA